MDQSSDIPSQPLAPAQVKHTSIFKFLIMGIAFILVLGVGFTAGSLIKSESSNQSSNAALTNLKETNSESPSPTSAIKTENEWVRTSFMGAYSFEYPKGWHVTSKWPENMDNGILVMMDPQPISDSPRDGPPSKIYFTDRNGFSNAQAELTKKRQEFKENYADVTEEEIKSNSFTIYHYTGKFEGEFMPGAIINEYMFIIEGFDDINDRLIILSTINDPASDDLLHHIALSFRESQ